MSVQGVRPFEPADVEPVVTLSLRAWAPVFASFRSVLGHRIYERLYPDWEQQQATAVRDALSANETWVHADPDGVTGFVNVDFDVEEAAGEIHMIAVDPRCQRRGIAGALTAHAVDEMRRRGMTLATVGTGGDPGHRPARRLYEKAGFTSFPQVYYTMVLDPDDGDEP